MDILTRAELADKKTREEEEAIVRAAKEEAEKDRKARQRAKAKPKMKTSQELGGKAAFESMGLNC